MPSDVSTCAPARLSDGSVPAQRYGLGVMLRKGYPAFGNWKLGTGNWEPLVRGADVRHVPWGELPSELLELMRRQAAADPVVAQVEHQSRVSFLDVPPGASVSIRSSFESAFLEESRFATLREGYPETAFLVVRLGEQARAQWFAPCLARPGFVFTEWLVWLERGASLTYHGAAVAADALRENLHIVLAGEGASAHVNTLFAGAATNQFDFGVTAEHRAPRTTSDLRAKGILGGKAQGVYRGLVRVGKNATKSDGYQRCDALLLSPTVEVDPIPQLEIDTSDVRCTHGVTVSHLNAEQLFYLQSRGFSEAAARDLLVAGFAGTMLRSWPSGEREKLLRAVTETLR